MKRALKNTQCSSFKLAVGDDKYSKITNPVGLIIRPAITDCPTSDILSDADDTLISVYYRHL